jgi:hypothetical protein
LTPSIITHRRLLCGGNGHSVYRISNRYTAPAQTK